MDPLLPLQDHPRSPERTTHNFGNSTTSRIDYFRPQEFLFKVIIIGDAAVGKTSFVQRYIQTKFCKDYKPTVGVDFALKILSWTPTQTVKLQLWDIAGQERFTWMTRVYYKESHGCVVLFDLTSRQSFTNAIRWKKDVDAKCDFGDGSPLPCILLANKCDLKERQVEQLEIEAMCRDHGFIGWTEISAKEDLMISDSMRFLVDTMLLRSFSTRHLPTESSLSQSFRLNATESSSRKPSSCQC